jgi:rhodanese-related sulfurtransferase
LAEKFTEFASKSENPHFQDVYDIDPTELKNKMTDVKLIDVRQPEEYTGELGHIENSELIVLNTLPASLEKIPRDQTVVFICKAGGRSAQAAAFARQHGFDNIYNLKGGMMLWNQLQLPISQNEK